MSEAPRKTYCRSCGAPIWWRVTPSGRRQPMDWDTEADAPAEVSHFATCPQAKQWGARR